MSIRPNIYTVFGIDTFDGDLPESFWEQKVLIPGNATGDLAHVKDYAYDSVSKEWQWYSEVVYYCPQTSNRNVIGLIKSHDFDSDTFRVLAMLYPEFYKSGRRDVPLIDDEWERQDRLRNLIWTPKCGDIVFSERWLYPQGYHLMTPIWAYVTKWLLDDLGVKSAPNEYKWMLVWDWC